MTVPETECVFFIINVMRNSDALNIQPVPILCGLHAHISGATWFP